LGISLKITEVALMLGLLSSTVKVVCQFWKKHKLGYRLGAFLANSSGYPGGVHISSNCRSRSSFSGSPCPRVFWRVWLTCKEW
jgi:hypothetical protein